MGVIYDYISKIRTQSLYHVSKNSELELLIPGISKKLLKGEDATTKRISAAPTIDGCFRMVGYSVKEMPARYYVYRLLITKDTEVVRPTKDQVPDVELGDEYWILTPTRVELIGCIDISYDSISKTFIFDDYVTPISKSQLLKTEDPDIFVKVKSSVNPNDTESQKAEDVIFFDHKGIMIGSVSVSGIDTKNAFLYNVEVLPKYRGMGYGTKIMNYMMANYSITILSVEPSNKIAIKLYNKFGFVEGHSYYENGRKLITMAHK